MRNIFFSSDEKATGEGMCIEFNVLKVIWAPVEHAFGYYDDKIHESKKAREARAASSVY